MSSSGDLAGGAERCLLDLATGLTATGWDPHVALPFDGELRGALTEAGVPNASMRLGVLRSRRELRSLRFVQRLAEIPVGVYRLVRLGRRERAVLVHSNSSAVVAGALAARFLGVPHVWHVREILDGAAWRAVRPAILRLSARVVCISPSVADHVDPDRSHRGQVVVIPDATRMEQWSVVGRPGPGTTVGMVARVTPMKGHRVLLDAARLLVQRFPLLQVRLAGGALPAYANLERELRADARTKPLSGHVHFEGHLDRLALRRFMSEINMLVVPSVRPEGGGLVALEAMASGVPVIASAHGGPVDLIEDGVTGLLVAPSDPRALADGIARLVTDGNLRQALGINARRSVEERFGLDAHIRAVAAVYQAALDAR